MNNKQNLLINKEFKALSIPKTNEEYSLLEENICAKGCKKTIYIWNKTIIDGHYRYLICTKNDIKFRTKNINFNDKFTAKNWICKNQLKKKDISYRARIYLIGKRYEIAKTYFNYKRFSNKFYTEHLKKSFKGKYISYKVFSAMQLCEEYKIAYRTLLEYLHFTKSVEIIREYNPKLGEDILQGKLKISRLKIISIAKEIEKSSNNASRKKLTIKDMPEYDPNAEITSLTFTIPSWIESLDRVLSLYKYKTATSDAKNKLSLELNKLKNSIGTMQLALEE